MSIPDKYKVDDATAERLAEILKANHAGKEKAATAGDLIMELLGHRPKQYDRLIRVAMANIIEHGGLVCSSVADGYWWAQSYEDGMQSVERKIHRARVQLANASKLKGNIYKAFPVQEQLL